jgi:hypothetical protein
VICPTGPNQFNLLRTPPRSLDKMKQNRVRQNAIFMKHFKLIWVVQSCPAKIFRFSTN